MKRFIEWVKKLLFRNKAKRIVDQHIKTLEIEERNAQYYQEEEKYYSELTDKVYEELTKVYFDQTCDFCRSQAKKLVNEERSKPTVEF